MAHAGVLFQPTGVKVKEIELQAVLVTCTLVEDLQADLLSGFETYDPMSGELLCFPEI